MSLNGNDFNFVCQNDEAATFIKNYIASSNVYVITMNP